jgi:hypothetical protein
MTWGEGAITRVKQMPKDELETRLLDAWEALEGYEEREEVAEKELTEMRARCALIQQCCDAVALVAQDAKPLEFEHILKDHAPFKNIMQHFFGKGKRGKKWAK